jgi:hypothetical protein
MSQPTRRRPSAPTDDETSPARRSTTAPLPRQPTAPSRRCRLAQPHSTPARGRRPVRLPRPTENAGCLQATQQAARESSPRSAPITPARPRDRTHPPAATRSNPAAAQATPADCPSSRRRSDHARARRAQTGRPSPTTPGHPQCAAPQRGAAAVPGAPRSANAQRTAPPPTPLTAVVPQTPSPAPTHDPTTGRHPPRTPAGAPRRPPTASSTPPAPPEIDPVQAHHSARTRSPAPRAAEPGAGPGAIVKCCGFGNEE